LAKSEDITERIPAIFIFCADETLILHCVTNSVFAIVKHNL